MSSVAFGFGIVQLNRYSFVNNVSVFSNIADVIQLNELTLFLSFYNKLISMDIT